MSTESIFLESVLGLQHRSLSTEYQDTCTFTSRCRTCESSTMTIHDLSQTIRLSLPFRIYALRGGYGVDTSSRWSTRNGDHEFKESNRRKSVLSGRHAEEDEGSNADGNANRPGSSYKTSLGRGKRGKGQQGPNREGLRWEQDEDVIQEEELDIDIGQVIVVHECDECEA